VAADPPRDAAHPAHNRQVLILSHGDGMNALFMLAAGAGPKPTMVLLHGLPGNEQNLDLAQAVRRAGWNVLTLHYRGSWGSPGRFSLAGAGEDVDAAMAFLRQPDTVAQYGIDTRRIVIAGHSLGGFLAARYAAAHDGVAGVVLIDPWNVGATGKQVTAHPETRQDAIADLGDDFGNSLAGTDAARLMAEAERHAQDWDLLDTVPALATKPVLIVAAEHGNAAQVAPLAAALKGRRGAQVQAVTLPSDHAFADRRIGLASVAVDWLGARRSHTAAK
jgi:pimeloyl-ACP methyl ester carboxylesterase